MKRRVVITGMGCVTPLGNEVETVWDSLVRGISGAGPITLFDASRFPTRIAAEVKDQTVGWRMSGQKGLDVGTDTPRKTLQSYVA